MVAGVLVYSQIMQLPAPWGGVGVFEQCREGLARHSVECADDELECEVVRQITVGGQRFHQRVEPFRVALQSVDISCSVNSFEATLANLGDSNSALSVSDR